MTELEAIKESELTWIGIDLDKTIAGNSAYPEFKLLDPLPGAQESLQRLTDDGWKVIIVTARAWHEYPLIGNWLREHNIPFEKIICGKVFVKWMIDDRNIEFDGDWDKAYSKVK